MDARVPLSLRTGRVTYVRARRTFTSKAVFSTNGSHVIIIVTGIKIPLAFRASEVASLRSENNAIPTGKQIGERVHNIL
jgi:hypothetical protein